MKFPIGLRLRKGLALLLCSSMIVSTDTASVFADEINKGTATDYELEVEDVVEEPVEDTIIPEDEGIIEDAINEPEKEGNVSDNEVFDSEETTEEEIEISSVSDDIISISENNADGCIKGLKILNGTGKVDKNLNVSLSWKKPNPKTCIPSFNGKFEYRIYKMNSDGTFGDYVTTEKNNYRDMANSGGAMVYRVVPVGRDKNYGNVYIGEASFIVVAPLIVSINRVNDPNSTRIRMDVSFLNMGADSNVVQYRLYRGYKNNKNAFTRVEGADLDEIGVVSDYVTKKGQKTKAFVVQDRDSEALYHGSQIYYKVGVAISYNGIEASEMPEAVSTAFRVKINERAPKTATAFEMTGTRALLAWEDMTGNGGADAKNSLLEGEDYYQIYYSMNGGNLKKYKKILVDSLPIINTVSGDVVLKASDGDEDDDNLPSDIRIPRNGRYSTYYICENLKANASYKFYVAPVRNKVEGYKRESNSVTTDILGMKNISVAQTTDNSLTVTWDKVEGAASYKLYFKKFDNVEEARTASANWLDLNDQQLQSVIAPDKKVKTKGIVSVKAGKGDKVSFEIKELESRSYYAIKVVPLRPDNKKLGNYIITFLKEDRDSVATAIGIVRLATPALTVKEDTKSGKVTFSWKKINGAKGYFVRYYYYNAGVKTYSDYHVLSRDAQILGSQKLELTSDEFKGNFGLGDGMSCQLFAFDSTFDYENNAYGSDTSCACSGWSELKSGFYRPNNPDDAIAVYNQNSTGAQIIANNASTSSTQAGVKVYRSYDGKTYDLVAPFSVNFFDNDPLTDGKTVYYKVYAAAYSTRSGRTGGYKPEYENLLVLSKKPAVLKYCQPTIAKHSNVNVKVGSAENVTLSFKPSGTTMKQIASWKITDDVDGNNPRFVETGNGTDSNNGRIHAVAYNYSDFDKNAKDKGVAGLSPKIKITGKKAGSVYITAITKNGCEATFKVTISESDADKDDKDSKEKDKGKVVIVLDPGHGGSDSGTTYGGMKESEINLKISQYTKDYLEEKYGYSVYLTRKSDTYVGLEDRVNVAKDKNAKAIISQHINSGGASGVECWHSIYDSDSSNGTKLAKKLCSRTAEAMGVTNRGAKTRKGDNGDYYAIVRYAHAKGLTGVIMENGFIDNAGDREKMFSSDSKLKEIAKANAKAIHDIYG